MYVRQKFRIYLFTFHINVTRKYFLEAALLACERMRMRRKIQIKGNQEAEREEKEEHRKSEKFKCV